MPPTVEIVAYVCLGWYAFISLVCALGCVKLLQHYSSRPKPPISTTLPIEETPHVTIIRPCKGREPFLYDCLSSSLRQNYPASKLTVYFCISTRDDRAYETILRVLSDNAEFDAMLLVEDEDLELRDRALGPNPKIRNMSRAYRDAKSDIVWILDCNIWSSPGACGRMVDGLCGFSSKGAVRPFKFVHHLPVAVDVPADEAFHYELASAGEESNGSIHSSSMPLHSTGDAFGGRLDEAFLSSAHAKMYVAINAVAVAPCICGKSSMFRRSHLNALTNADNSTETRFGTGIDHFSENICEDHLIGDLLWKAKIPETMPASAKQWRNHGLIYGDLALQPVARMSVAAYVARRVRWLRVRKFTVPLATLVEPCTESILCSFIGAYGLAHAPFMAGIIVPDWSTVFALWLTSMFIWILTDWTVYKLLQSGSTIEATASEDPQIPLFARYIHSSPFRSRRTLWVWLKSWLVREALALPVWTWAIWGGVTVVWRDKKLWVGLDMKVHEMDGGKIDNEEFRPLMEDASRLAVAANNHGDTDSRKRRG